MTFVTGRHLLFEGFEIKGEFQDLVGLDFDQLRGTAGGRGDIDGELTPNRRDKQQYY